MELSLPFRKKTFNRLAKLFSIMQTKFEQINRNRSMGRLDAVIENFDTLKRLGLSFLASISC